MLIMITLSQNKILKNLSRQGNISIKEVFEAMLPSFLFKKKMYSKSVIIANLKFYFSNTLSNVSLITLL